MKHCCCTILFVAGIAGKGITLNHFIIIDTTMNGASNFMMDFLIPSLIHTLLLNKCLYKY